MNLDYLLPALTLVIVFTILMILIVNYVDPPIPDYVDGDVVCPIGTCSVHRLSGKKTCDIDGPVRMNVVTEVCASRTACDTRNNPYAVQPNGATLDSFNPELSLCPNGSQCACVGIQQCSENTTVFWSAVNNNQIFTQQVMYSIAGSNNKDLTPMSIPEGSRCTINRYTYNTQAFWPSKCIRGFLAYWTVDGTLLSDSPIGCFVAKNMDDFTNDSILIYDESTERFSGV